MQLQLMGTLCLAELSHQEALAGFCHLGNALTDSHPESGAGALAAEQSATLAGVLSIR